MTPSCFILHNRGNSELPCSLSVKQISLFHNYLKQIHLKYLSKSKGLHRRISSCQAQIPTQPSSMTVCQFLQTNPTFVFTHMCFYHLKYVTYTKLILQYCKCKSHNVTSGRIKKFDDKTFSSVRSSGNWI